jgi:NAD(P)-dependent dehydrogenase (short-subunit alcohol dehydrogenase family)
MPAATRSRVILTGASRGLGRALAIAFAREGARLAVCARGGPALSGLAEEIAAAGGEPALVDAVDLADPAQALSFARGALGALRGADTLIHNASILGPRVPLTAYPEEDFSRVMAVNVTAPFLISREVAPAMAAAGSGSIIMVTSTVGQTAKPRWGAYLVSKFAIEGMARMMALEMQGTGVRVNLVNPGAMRTDMRREAYPEEDPATLRNPSSLVKVFLHLASDEAAGVTGQRFEAAQFG